jgi:predicted transposase/invertase (TIGR01784 family)
MKFLDAESKEDLEMIAEKTRMAYDNRQKWIWDQTAREREAREEGMAQGIAVGKEEDAIKMLKKGMKMELIQDITEIPLDKLQQMQKEITS